MNALEGLNDKQLEAVTFFEGPLLILAGAGSGKTRVLTNRIAWLIGEKGVAPWNILAITFTNKAADEMRARVNRMVGDGADAVWVATFHSTCARILRRYIDCLGYQTNFTIYDADDQKTLMKEVCKTLQIDTRVIKEKAILSMISHAKDELTGVEEFERNTGRDWVLQKAAAAYREYQKRLKENNALDFDDLIFLTVELLRREPAILHQYRNKFRFILVDEYQDTNTAQFELVRILAGEEANLCVVGDDDQSIYGFRGANIRNILSFEEEYPGTKTIRLEQNYRSTQQILDAANAVIANNKGRKAKRLWTENEEGERVKLRRFATGSEEAEFIARDILCKTERGEFSYKDCAVLYRTNAQSRMLEEKLVFSNIPYRIFGGINFYARREIKDLLSYLKTVDNAQDDLAVKRIINVPKRGIGAASIAKVQTYADVNSLPFFEALKSAPQIPGIGRSASKMRQFVRLILSLREVKDEISLKELLERILKETDYMAELEAEGKEEAEERTRNIDELVSKAVSYEEGAETPSLSDFLQEVSLVADIDNLDGRSEHVVLMTLHSAKGLEFPCVYIVGMEDGLFPGYRSVGEENAKEALEEERRLCYVGFTRAKKELTLTCADRRMLRGQMNYSIPSRFLAEIPKELLHTQYGGYDSARNAVPRSSPAVTIPSSQTEVSNVGAVFREKAFDPSAYQVVKASSLSYDVGDRVCHKKFGEGTVQEIRDGGRDYEVTVLFDTAGIKKMFAGFAKLEPV